MGPFLESLGSSVDIGTPVGPLLEELKAKNAAELKRLEADIEALEVLHRRADELTVRSGSNPVKAVAR